jgi:hypothetical protein
MHPAMTHRALVLLTLVLIASSTFAQTTTKTTHRPNIPGSIILDFGFNAGINKPDLWKQGLLGSHSVNIYYQYPIRFGRSRFSFNPGAGFSFERFRWKNNIYLVNPVESGANQVEKYEFGAAKYQYPNPKKPILGTNYFEIPIEFRFDTKPEDISRSFNVAIGARGGWMFDSFMKIKYHDEGQNKKVKDDQNFGLTRLRYGVYTRVGIGALNFFVFYNMTPLFQKDKGPFDQGKIQEPNIIQGGTTGTTMNTITAGISLNAF